MRTPRFSLARRALPGRGGAGSRWRLRLAGSLPPAATATSAATAALVGRRSRHGFGPRPLGPRRWDGRHDASQAARPAPPARLLAGPSVVLLDALVELGEPLFHRPFDLGTGRSWLLGPDPRTVGSNGFRWWIGVGRLGLDRDFRREFRHLSKC
ncbi:MAG: hypothetical protein E6H93_09465 [Chloroflexi bacterium]|nr:MAG: hypothetical protein E6H93_09465 [Chloroflexota bacterium]